ncbi:uncharacterized protein Dere_GG16538 [Drosophila erecta]|uniref:Peptidase S1 domain-containing protein n=2 Tax=Drosophila erecta TaxID=7220 RepID=B3NMX4_DROER|nr:uncharacterized protein Dere_GG16538 [Drosophila erecta]
MPNAIKIAVDAYLKHPKYVHYNQNDITLFRLITPVQFTAYIKPICLVTDNDVLNYITYMNVTGWGITENRVASQVLMTTTLTKMDRSYCSHAYGYQVDESHICAWDYTSSACPGDSGGPLFAKVRISGLDRVVQLGIVSYGSEQCRGMGVYTNVFYYMNWIKDAIRVGTPNTINNSAAAWK